MQSYRRSRGLTPLILNLGTRCRWVVNFTLRPFYPWEGSITHWIAGLVRLRASMDVLEKRKISCPYWDSNPAPSVPLYIYIYIYIYGNLFYPLQCSFIMNVLHFWCLPSEFSVYSIGLWVYFTFSFCLSYTCACVALFESCCLYVYIRRWTVPLYSTIQWCQWM
jgi:hypothetical protein